MRFSVDGADWLPPEVRSKLREQNPNRINKKGEFVVQSDALRTQAGNLEGCLNIIYECIVKAAYVPKGPSEEKLQRIQELKEEQLEKKVFHKTVRSSKKQFRKGGDW
ncbi:hypothetical protein HK097_004621 [Rhizophlyctis rosea]|uniref:Uncharacterized protein n=1 Tax=Rhizophlyctis rosea TaxID=64517 RepID=A0AAD5SLV5_9FUNG|nr:hypothetical protein HK097_004621 [Rhizophlyctis rosea]